MIFEEKAPSLLVGRWVDVYRAGSCALDGKAFVCKVSTSPCERLFFLKECIDALRNAIFLNVSPNAVSWI
jgi:hypothetical protein